jgi:hypothetical protein
LKAAREATNLVIRQHLFRSDVIALEFEALGEVLEKTKLFNDSVLIYELL